MQSAGEVRIAVGAPTGSYRPAERTFEFALRPGISFHEGSLDGQSLVAVEPTATGDGWFQKEGRVIVRLRDDGGAHQIRIK